MTYQPPAPQPAPPAPLPFNPNPMPTGVTLTTDANIQGNVLAGFNKDYASLLFLQLADHPSGLAYLGALLPLVATNAEVAAFNTAFSGARAAGGQDPDDLNATWVGVSITAHGLGVLSPSGSQSVGQPGWDPAVAKFLAGAITAPDIPAQGPESAATWLFGGPGTQLIDLVVVVGSDSAEGLAGALAELSVMAGTHKVLTVFEQPGATLPGRGRGHEHFGFKDGISQPHVMGFDPPNPAGAPAQSPPLIETGEFLLGYPGHDGHQRPVPPWMFDGSFLVVRRLAQDVPGFWGQASALAKDLNPDPGAEALAARLVGRWKDGTPVAEAPNADPRVGPDETADNDFDFSNDIAGAATPLFAHIRKINPRNGTTPGLNAVGARRIIRRGIPFGEPFDPSLGRDHGPDSPRGLVFACYQASIGDQFEFLQNSWADQTAFPQANAGPDPVIGPAGTCPLSQGGGNPVALSVGRFITLEGALYAFTPSIPTLQAIASGQALGN